MLNKMFVPKERYKIDGKLQKMGKEKIIIRNKFLVKCGKVQIFGNNYNKSKRDPGGN
jgi:hypothetical protein